MNSPTIVTLTMNASLDKSADVERVIPDDKLRCTQPRYDPGGGGINVARAVTKLGGHAMALYLAGGWSGDRLTDLLDNEGVPNRRIPIAKDTRESLIINETQTGQQFRFGMPGPELGPEDCERVIDELSKIEPAPEFLVAAGSLPPGVPENFYQQIATLSHKRGIRVNVDTYGGALRHALAGNLFLIKPNLRELGQLVGEEMTSDAQIEATARKLLDDGACDICVVSMGAAGALWASHTGLYRLRAPTVHIASRVGAGDCTLAGIILALSRGWTERQALAFGVAAGAAAVMTPGTELCRREDTERLYATLLDEKPESIS